MENRAINDPIIKAKKMFAIIVDGRDVERIDVQNQLVTNNSSFDRAYLRKQISEALTNKYSSQNESDFQKGNRWVRCWLLGALGRVADDDNNAISLIRKNLDINIEKDPWARYWALESLVAINYKDKKNLATQIVKREKNIVDNLKQTSDNFKEEEIKKLHYMLASAIIAAEDKTRNEFYTIKKELKNKNDDSLSAVLRALRVVPIEEFVDNLCKIVESPRFNDNTYDAIFALGILPLDWKKKVEKANDALIQCVKKCQTYRWWDALRLTALRSLGDLQLPASELILVEELMDSNPSIVSEAARALEKCVGVTLGTQRVVEAACKPGVESIQNYADSLRWMCKEKVTDELESIMVSGPYDQQETARMLLTEVGGKLAFQKLRARQATIDQQIKLFKEEENKVNDYMDKTINEARWGFISAIIMDIGVFVLGGFLIVISGIILLKGNIATNTIGTISSGILGLVGIVYSLFLSNSRAKLQQAVEYQTATKIIFRGYIQQLHEVEGLYVRRFLEDKPVIPEEINNYPIAISESIEKALGNVYKLAGIRYPVENGHTSDIIIKLANALKER